MDRSDRDDARLFLGGNSLAGVQYVNTREVFRKLIAQELRSGRLTPARRRRLVRYAEEFRLSPVETERLIAECRAEALESDDPEVICHALRVIEPSPQAMPLIVKLIIALIVAIVLYDLAARLL